MDFGRGLSFVRQDSNWLVKTILGSVMFLVPILNFAPLGYMLDVTRNVHEGRETPLPEWGENFGQIWVRGLLSVVIQFIYTLPVLLLTCPLFLLVVIAGESTATARSGAPNAMFGLAMLCLVPLLIIGTLGLGVLALVAQARYAITNDFGAAMQVGAVVSELRQKPGQWFGIIGMMLVLGFAFSVVAAITCGLGMLVYFYIMLAQAHWMGQAIGSSRGREGLAPTMI